MAPHTPDRLHGRTLLSALSAALLAISACGGPAEGPADLAFDASDGVLRSAVPTTVEADAESRPPRTTTTQAAPVPAGDPTQPFAELPPSAEATAVMTPSGVVLPVVSDRRESTGRDSWIVITPCSDVRTISGGEPLGRAHVVLDPGHGGREFGAVGPNDVVEKDINLAVAQAAETMLTEAGATVILTRSTDVSITTGARAALARTVKPALFVSVHHNGGAPATGDRPGTIVFTKSNSPESTRFGGLFHQALTPDLEEVASAAHERFQIYADAFVAHENVVAAYDASLVARDAALAANGQIDPASTTLPPLPPGVDNRDAPDDARRRVDGTEVASTRQPVTTITVPIPDDRMPVAVPDTIPVPPPFDVERVPEFRWAGTGNAGVRSWRSDDGRDLLSVLRRSGDVPSALVEYLYVTNPVEEALLADPAFIELEARALTDAIVAYLSTDAEGTGFVADQVGDQNIGGGGRRSDCIEPDLGFGSGSGNSETSGEPAGPDAS